MSKDIYRTAMMLFVLLSAGCLQAIDDTIEDVDDAIEQTIKALDGAYPQIDLPERIRVSPELRVYDACDALLSDLKGAVRDETMVSLDQQSYWHWVS